MSKTTVTRKDVSVDQIMDALSESNGNITAAAKLLGTSRQLLTYWVNNEEQIALRFSFVRTEKAKQASQDKNRIEKKAFRDHARAENAITPLLKDIRKLLSESGNKLTSRTRKHKSDSRKAVGVVQISDAHLNECVMLEHNTYNYDVASKRLRKHILSSMELFRAKGVTNVLFALTGDLMNSDRRLDELLNNHLNRAKSIFLSVDILSQAILELNTEFNVSVASITGNESRIPEDIGWSDSMATDNYDFLIHGMLECQMSGLEGITFIKGDATELVVNVAGQNLMLVHGHGGAGGAGLDKRMLALKGRYASRGTQIDYIISGHTHESYISDQFARSASLVGANDYSEKALNLPSRAAQNAYLFYTDGSVDGLKVDLQNVDGVVGYSFRKELEAYNSKSADKLHTNVVIHKIVV